MWVCFPPVYVGSHTVNIIMADQSPEAGEEETLTNVLAGLSGSLKNGSALHPVHPPASPATSTVDGLRATG